MAKTIKETISHNIAKYRKISGLSQKELAHKLGAKNLTTVSSWERGISSPDADTIIKICELFSISLNDLYDIPEDFLNPQEQEHINNYRALDIFGKKAINVLMEVELQRVDSLQNGNTLKLVGRNGKIILEGDRREMAEAIKKDLANAKPLPDGIV